MPARLKFDTILAAMRQNGSDPKHPWRPDLSVIIVIAEQRQRGERALRSLLEQNVIERMEIIIMDLSSKETPPLDGSDHPRVSLVRITNGITFGDARAQAVRIACAPVIAFMEEHCVTHPGWAEAVLGAHQEPWAGVGCAFDLGNPDSGSSNFAFRATYGAYLPPRSGRGPTNWIAGHNSSYKKQILLDYGEELDCMLNADLVLNARLLRDGHAFFFEPAAKMSHYNEHLLRNLMMGIFLWNWCFSKARSRSLNWPLARRICYVTLLPLIPWVRLFKTLWWRAKTGFPAFLECAWEAPLILAVHYCSAVGQLAGFFLKIGLAERRFSDFEMNKPRLTRAEFAG